jgi:drug/metabolite transporter (DMT)-like permease
VAVIYWDRTHVSMAQAFAVGIAFAGVVCSTTYSVMVKHHGQGVHPFASSTIFLGTTGLALGGWALAAGRPLPWPPPAAPTAALLYLALIGSVLAFACYFWMLQRISLMAASTLVLVQPCLALLVDALFEQQVRLTPRAYVGVAITIGGLLLGVLLRRRR